MSTHAAITREVPVTRVRKRRTYPFKYMQPGWSFFIIPDPDEDIPTVDRLIRSAIYSYQRNFPKGQAPQFEVYVAPVGATARKCVRCTQLASAGPDGVADQPKFTATWTTRPLPYGRVKPGECFDIKMPPGCPKPTALRGVRQNIRWNFPGAAFRVEITTRQGKEVIHVFRYV